MPVIGPLENSELPQMDYVPGFGKQLHTSVRSQSCLESIASWTGPRLIIVRVG